MLDLAATQLPCRRSIYLFHPQMALSAHVFGLALASPAMRLGHPK